MPIMGKCSVCGYSDVVKMRTKCLRCGVGVCAGCASSKGIVENEQGYRYLYCPKCAEEEVQVRLSRNQASQQSRKSKCPFCGSSDLECWVRKEFSYELHKTLWNSGERCNGCGRVLDSRNLEVLRKAEEAQAAGHYEESARLYDDLKMHEKAGQARDKGRRSSIDFHGLDGEALVERLRTGGFAIPYKCTHCGTRVIFDKDRSADRFFICEHCSTTFEAFDLAKVLSGLL
jgi:DNA-directed RNA polymerase subunit RPC12/RpoP